MKLKEEELDKLKKEINGGGFLFENEAQSDLKGHRVKIYLSTFDRIGLKGCDISNSSFTQCVFINCYGRKANFTNVDFTGSVFINCNFHGAKFSSCNFRYCEFRNTDVPVNEISSCLPSEYNLRGDLCRNLKVNFASLGDKKTADVFLQLEIKAIKKELSAIFWGKTEYYRQKYDLIERFKSLLGLLRFNLSGFFYGHGINVWMLFISFATVSLLLTLSCIAFGGVFTSNYDLNSIPEPQSLSFFKVWLLMISEAIKYSFISYTPACAISEGLLYLARIMGLFYLGLITATIYRRIAR